MRFSRVDGTYAVARLAPDTAVPAWAGDAGGFVSITRTPDELSIVCTEAAVPSGVLVERGWALLKIAGPLAFGEIGVLASVAAPLAAARISLFVVSTFDTDYILIKSAQADAACRELIAAGHELAP
jgi:hypothetical protein